MLRHLRAILIILFGISALNSLSSAQVTESPNAVAQIPEHINTAAAVSDDQTPQDDIGNSTLIGDMILDPDQLKFLNQNSTNSKSEKLMLEDPFLLWPNATVTYTFDKSVQQDAAAKKILIEAMQRLENISCVRFQPKSEDSLHYVLMKKGKICSSKVGFRREEAQLLFIDASSCSVGSIVHELLHTLSFLHMHTAKNRDDYIEINWSNIRDDAKPNYQIFSAPITMMETEYDYDSITHYSNFAFAVNKKVPTIVAKNPEKGKNMGQRKNLSPGDILRLNRLYQCPGFETKSTKVISESSQSSDEPNDLNASVEAPKASNKTSTDEVISNETSSDEEKASNSSTPLDDDDQDDMVLTQDQIDSLYSTNAAKRNGLKSAFHHWPNGVVPFEIDRSFRPQTVQIFMQSMSYIANRTCIRFSPRNFQNQNYIYITRGPGCSSEVGMRRTGKQLMNINESLCPRGKIIHELLHALGFLHMHTANDRDNYLRVNWNNIKDNAKFNFKQFVSHVSMFSTPYDYNSIMHYSSKAFAKNRNQMTLIPIQTGSARNMGQREGMSVGDIVRLNRMYKCGAPYLTSMPSGPQTSASTTAPPPLAPLPLPSSPGKVEKDSNKVEATPDKPQAPTNRTIFGVLIFKAIEG